MEDDFKKAKEAFLEAIREINSLPTFEEAGKGVTADLSEEEAEKELAAYRKLRETGKPYYELLGAKLGWDEELIKRKIASL